jgi:hypothetical protein
MDRAKNLILAVAPRRLVTPCGFVWAALALCLLYAVCHGLGWREYTGFLCGSAPLGERAALCLVPGIVYVVAYLGFVLVAPILVLASGIFALLVRPRRWDRPPREVAGD